METQIAIIAFIAFSVASLVVILVSLFGTKEKTYEDALAEQREHSNALLGIHTRPKPKDKKQKKASKKVKEKQASPPSTESVEDSENTEASPSETSSVSNSPKTNLHVGFKKPTVIEVTSEEIQIPHLLSKQKHVKKVRPILVQREDREIPITSDVFDVTPANHFEQIHPKDEFELIRSRSNSRTRDGSTSRQDTTTNEKQKLKQNSCDSDPVKENKPKIEEETAKEKANKKNQEQQQEFGKEVVKEKQNESQKTNKKNKKQKEAGSAEIEKEEIEKETKKEESIIEAVPEVVEQIPVQSAPVTHSAKDKKRKKNETHLLQQITGANREIDVQLLLDVVRTAELSRSEVQILIDLLLNKQHEAPPDSEWSEGKADPVQKLKKQLAEKEKLLAEEQEALAGAQAKLREIRAEQQAEKSQQQQRIRGLEEALQAKHLDFQAANNRLHTQNQKMQQLQAQLNEDAATFNKLSEEQEAWVVHRQQLEMRLTQTQEGEATIVQLRNELQEMQNRNNQLTIELHSLNEQSLAAKDHQQTVIVQMQHQLTCFKNEMDQKNEYIRQLEESRIDWEHRLNVEHRKENDLQVEVSQLKTIIEQNADEIRHLEHGKNQALEEIKKMEKQREEFERKEQEFEKTLAQLNSQLEVIKVEKEEIQRSHQNSLSDEIKDYQEQIRSLQDDLRTVTTEIQDNQKKHDEEIDRFNNLVNRLQTDLHNSKNKDETLEAELDKYKNLTNNLQDQLKSSVEEVQALSKALDEQKAKNDDLRQKNWKVVEALNAAENKLKSLLNSSKQPSTEKELQQKVIERRDVRQQTDEQKSQKTDNSEEISKLQAQIVNYKSIIDNTEGVLKRLESHIEHEELTWRQQLKAKELEIEALKQECIEGLKGKVSELEVLLVNERSSKGKIKEDYEKLKNSSIDNSAIIEKLSEEINRLTQQLEGERKMNLEIVDKNLQEPPKMTEISNGCEKQVQNGSNNGSTPIIPEAAPQ